MRTLPTPRPAVCADGYGGSLQTTEPTPSGCTICSPGHFGAALGLRTACASCKSAGLSAFSSKPGAAVCETCPNAQAADAQATGCGEALARQAAGGAGGGVPGSLFPSCHKFYNLSGMGDSTPALHILCVPPAR
jgi:hypothetical protein